MKRLEVNFGVGDTSNVEFMYGGTDTYVFDVDEHGVPDLNGADVLVSLGDGDDVDPSQVKSVRLAGKDLLAFLALYVRREQAAKMALTSDAAVLGSVSQGRT